MITVAIQESGVADSTQNGEIVRFIRLNSKVNLSVSGQSHIKDISGRSKVKMEISD